MSPPQMNLSCSVKDFGTCGSCGLKLCSALSPQLLPCLHSLCRDCFTHAEETKGPECPICQEKYKLQEVISNLVFEDSSSVLKESIKCGGCEDSAVTGWCVECQESLCAICVAAHRRVKVARQHFVHTLTPESPRPVICPLHKKTQVNKYCLTCDQLTCRLCSRFHHNHLLQDVPKAMLCQRRQIRRMVQKVSYKRLATQKNLTDVESRLNDLEELEMRVKLEVKKTVVSLCNVIVKKAAKLLKEMEDLCGKERGQLADQKVMLQHLQKKQEHVLAFTDKALAFQDHTVLLSCKKQIRHQLQNLLEQNAFSTPTVMELTFQCNKANVKKVLKAFGYIVVRQLPSASYQIQNLPDQTPKVLPPTQSPGIPTESFQNPSTNTTAIESSPRMGHLPQATPPQRTSNPPIRARLCLASAKQYSNSPKLKRPWSYHPYHPSEGAHLPQTAIKSLKQKKYSLESVLTSPALSNKLSASPLEGACVLTQTSCAKTTSSPSVGPPQNNGCLDGDLLKQTSNLSPAEPNLSPLCVVQTIASSTCLSVPAKGSVGSIHKMKATSSVPDTPISSLLPSEGTNPVLTEARQAGGQTVGEHHHFPPESSSTNLTLNSSAVELSTNRLEKHLGSVSMSFLPFCVKNRSSAGNRAPSPPKVMSPGSDNRKVEANRWLQTTPTPFTDDSQPQCPSHQEHAEISPHQGTSVLQQREESLEETMRVTSLSILGSLPSLPADHVKLPKDIKISTNEVKPKEERPNDIRNNTMTSKAEVNGLHLKTIQNSTQTSVPVKDEKVNTELSLALPDLMNSYCFPVEDDYYDTALIKVRDDEGNLVVLKSLGRNWLPDVTVCRLSVPGPAPCTPSPEFRILRREGSSDLQLSVIQDSEQSPALPILIPGCPHTSCPLSAKKLNCAACKLSGKLLQCSVCHRAFHRECHIPPLTSLINTKQWLCLLCRDLSNVENLEPYPECNGLPSLSLPDQRKCEYLLLALACKKQSSILYRSVKTFSHANRFVDVTLVRGRLQHDLMPPYRTPAEFVSDVWLLLSTPLNSSKEAQCMKKLQRFFSKELWRVFGQSLHSSLLKDPFRGEEINRQTGGKDAAK